VAKVDSLLPTFREKTHRSHFDRPSSPKGMFDVLMGTEKFSRNFGTDF
jgi:hypothetical protein